MNASLGHRRQGGTMIRKRGNPNWCQPGSWIVPHVVTAFEIQVCQLRLEKHDYVTSFQLKNWCLQNKDRRYVPEWLLDAWKMTVDVHYDNLTWLQRRWASDLEVNRCGGDSITGR
jgi:hypothetical protein